jgi:lipopolysaccharide transport system ATP-binding protein
VAAYLEPEILLVDEVLAVGDAEFQKKCMGKMDDVAQEGRTVLFVSHNMNAIQRLCPQSFMFQNGCLVAQGETKDIVTQYLSTSFHSSAPGDWIDLKDVGRRGTGEAYFEAISFRSPNANTGYMPYSNGPLEFSLAIQSNASRSVPSIAVTIFDQLGTKLVNADTISLGQAVSLKEGRNIVNLRINRLHLNPGTYVVGLWMANTSSGYVFDHIQSSIRIEVVDIEENSFGVRIDGAVTCDFEFSN